MNYLQYVFECICNDKLLKLSDMSKYETVIKKQNYYNLFAGEGVQGLFWSCKFYNFGFFQDLFPRSQALVSTIKFTPYHNNDTDI